MQDYALVTDSTADMPYEEVERLGIEVIPMEFIVDGVPYKHYADAREMSFEEFYKKVDAGAKVSTTQVTAYMYEDYFTPILEQGKDIIYICFTSGMSETYRNSQQAVEELKEKFPERRVVSIDSLCASVGEGFLAYKAGVLKSEGMGFDELVGWIEENKMRIAHWFVVDDLEHLRQGGRISAASAVVGTALNVKPLLNVDGEGKLVVKAKIRGMKKALDTFCQKMKDESAEIPTDVVLVGHAANMEMAQKLKDMVLEKGLAKRVMIADIGPIIGTHVGSGMCALIYVTRADVEK